MEYREEDYLMLSGIQHFVFCRRQWALIHIEQQWDENYRTTAGNIMHRRAHQDNTFERHGEKVIARGLRVSSRQLGITGQCDVVEFEKDEQGISLHGYEGKWRIVPVEYKRGQQKEGREDEIQLSLQAMCLEEMLLAHIQEGYLYYGEKHQRTKVEFTKELRGEVETDLMEMHDLFKRGYTPVVKTSTKCKSCSLIEICVPRLQKTVPVSEYIKTHISEEK